MTQAIDLKQLTVPSETVAHVLKADEAILNALALRVFGIARQKGDSLEPSDMRRAIERELHEWMGIDHIQQQLALQEIAAIHRESRYT